MGTWLAGIHKYLSLQSHSWVAIDASLLIRSLLTVSCQMVQDAEGTKAQGPDIATKEALCHGNGISLCNRLITEPLPQQRGLADPSPLLRTFILWFELMEHRAHDSMQQNGRRGSALPAS